MRTAIQTAEQPATVSPPVEPPAPPAHARSWRRPALFAVLGVAAAAIALTRVWPLLFSPPAETLLRASGRIEGREVTLAAKTIQGRVKRLFADEGQRVSKGQIVAELESSQVEAQVAAARAGVANLDALVHQALLDVEYTAKSAAAAIAAADAELSAARAHATRATAILTNATAIHQRATALFDARAISKQELDTAEMTLHTSRADAAAAEKDVTRAEANLALAKASADAVGLKRQQLRALQESRRSAAARLEETESNLAERQIVAPSNGTIVSRPVEVGDVVNPGTPLFEVVDMSRLYVKVYIPEPDIAKLRLGDPADVFVDAFPKRSFTARISKIYDQAEFTPKNVETAEERLKLVFGVELALDNFDGALKPGMPADCVIHWAPAGPNGGSHGP